MQDTFKNTPKIVIKKKRSVVVPTQKVKAKPAPKPEKAQVVEKKSKKSLHEIFSVFAECHPEAFGSEPKPLKIGIHTDLMQSPVREKLNHKECRGGLTGWVNGIKYLRVCTAGAQRVDLAGNASGEVTEEQAEHCETKLQKARARIKELDKQRGRKRKPRQSKVEPKAG